MMRHLFRMLGIFVFICVWNISTPAQTERIHDFHSDIQLLDDGTLLVKETITVFSNGNQIRHGIYREFPTHYKDRLGNNYVVGFHWFGATRDGGPETSRVEDYFNGKRIYLGDRNSYLPNGQHIYELSYSTNRQLGFFKDHDQLYWNVTGNGWGFPIDQASATVTLPATIAHSGVSLDGFTGPQGSFEKSFQSAALPENQFEFRATRPFAPHEGLSIILSWEKGLIAPPTAQQELNYFLTDNQDALLMAAGLVLLLIYYLIVWSAVGRDPKRGVIMPLYEPPANLSPAGMRYLVRMGFDNKTFAAAILDMAARGFLKIKFQAGSYTLYRTKADDRALTPDEKQIAAQMFRERKVLFYTNGRYLIPGIVFSVLVVATVAFLKSAATVLIVAFLLLWLSVWSLAVTGLIVATGTAWKEAFRSQGHAAPLVGKAALFTVFSLPFIAGEGLGIFFLTKFTSPSVALFLFASIALHILFHFLLKAPTMAGRRMLDQIEGFKTFLGSVDGDRMNRMNPPEQTPELFEKFLPYALALGVEQAWAEKFSAVLNAANHVPDSGAAGAAYSPSFYSGSNWTSFGAGAFTSGFTDSFAGAISSSSSAPGSSDGGGGSGGGGGGGGGGGW